MLGQKKCEYMNNHDTTSQAILGESAIDIIILKEDKLLCIKDNPFMMWQGNLVEGKYRESMGSIYHDFSHVIKHRITSMLYIIRCTI